MKVESIWAVLDLKKDQSDIKGESIEVFAVYHTGEKDPYLASFISEGVSLQGRDIFGAYLNERRMTSVGPNTADKAWANSFRR